MTAPFNNTFLDFDYDSDTEREILKSFERENVDVAEGGLVENVVRDNVHRADEVVTDPHAATKGTNGVAKNDALFMDNCMRRTHRSDSNISDDTTDSSKLDLDTSNSSGSESIPTQSNELYTEEHVDALDGIVLETYNLKVGWTMAYRCYREDPNRKIDRTKTNWSIIELDCYIYNLKIHLTNQKMELKEKELFFFVGVYLKQGGTMYRRVQGKCLYDALYADISNVIETLPGHAILLKYRSGKVNDGTIVYRNHRDTQKNSVGTFISDHEIDSNFLAPLSAKIHPLEFYIPDYITGTGSKKQWYRKVENSQVYDHLRDDIQRKRNTYKFDVEKLVSKCRKRIDDSNNRAVSVTAEKANPVLISMFKAMLDETELHMEELQDDEKTRMHAYNFIDYSWKLCSPVAFQLTVRCVVQRSNITIHAEPSDTIASIKAKLSGKINIPPKDQSLSLDGYRLEEKRTLRSYNIVKGSIVDLTISMRAKGENEVEINEQNWNKGRQQLNNDSSVSDGENDVLLDNGAMNDTTGEKSHKSFNSPSDDSDDDDVDRRHAQYITLVTESERILQIQRNKIDAIDDADDDSSESTEHYSELSTASNTINYEQKKGMCTTFPCSLNDEIRKKLKISGISDDNPSHGSDIDAWPRSTNIPHAIHKSVISSGSIGENKETLLDSRSATLQENGVEFMDIMEAKWDFTSVHKNDGIMISPRTVTIGPGPGTSLDSTSNTCEKKESLTDLLVPVPPCMRNSSNTCLLASFVFTSSTCENTESLTDLERISSNTCLESEDELSSISTRNTSRNGVEYTGGTSSDDDDDDYHKLLAKIVDTHRS